MDKGTNIPPKKTVKMQRILINPEMIEWYRKVHGISEIGLGSALGIEKFQLTAVSDMEHGRKTLTNTQIKQLCEIFKCTIEDLQQLRPPHPVWLGRIQRMFQQPG